MNLLKTYTKISQLSYRSSRSFGSFGTRTPGSTTPGTSTSSTQGDDLTRQAQNIANTAANAADATLRGVANVAGATLKGVADTADSVASTLAGNRDQQDRSNTYQRTSSYNPSSVAGNKPPEQFTSTNTQYTSFNNQGPTSGFNSPGTQTGSNEPFNQAASAAQGVVSAAANIAGAAVKGFADVAGSVASTLNNQTNRDTRYDDRNRDPYYNRDRDNSDRNTGANVVNSTIQGIANVANTVASNFIPGANTSSSSGSDPLRNIANNIAGSVVNSAVKGVTDAAANVASSFIPGGQSANSGNQNIVGAAVKGLGDVAQGLAGAASKVATSFMPNGIGVNRTSDYERVHHDRYDAHHNQNHHDHHRHTRHDVHRHRSTSGNDFIYTGSQVEDLTFTDANKQGRVDSGSLSDTLSNTVQNYAQTARGAAQDIGNMAYTGTRDFGQGATKAATDAINNFATAAGQAAISSAATVARNFNKIASATDEMHDNNQGFIYTGTQVRDNLSFTPQENKDLNDSFTTRRSHNHRLYDVVISGGGVNGAALACALAHSRYFGREDQKIMLLDPHAPSSLDQFHSKDTVADQRVVSLSLASVNFLKELGVWSLLNRDRIGSVRQMQVWEIGGNSFIKFNDNPQQDIGYVVENNHLQAAVFERLRALGNVKIEVPNKITDIRNDTDNFATVVLNDEEKISARLVVGSDGANSFVKQKARIASTGWSTNQTGIVCTVKTPYLNTTAWQRFLTTGPLAVLPLWDEYSSIVWSCESTLFKTLMEYDDKDFLRELNYNLTRKPLVDTPNFVFNSNAAFDFPPTITEICNKRRSFPLSFQNANQYVAHRIALIGDAAHTVHPLAGQGLNLGLMDAAYLANTVIKNLRTGNDIGSRDLLREYETASQNLNSTMIYGMEMIKRSYETNEINPIVYARNMATTVVNNMTPFKSLFVDIANGKYFQPTEYEWKK